VCGFIFRSQSPEKAGNYPFIVRIVTNFCLKCDSSQVFFMPYITIVIRFWRLNWFANNGSFTGAFALNVCAIIGQANK
jgi:hypothetical protein